MKNLFSIVIFFMAFMLGKFGYIQFKQKFMGDEEICRLQNEIKTKLPTRLDDATTLTNIECNPKTKKVIYFYDLNDVQNMQNISWRDFVEQDFDLFKQNFKNGVKEQYCNSDIKNKNFKATFTYNFDNEYFMDFTLGLSDCR
ncbi:MULTISPECIES: hypothetical protein [unclassified Campylobacter]|uniref:hypothetical protein n=1 Tax=unclassified Campylobacter TaxID=2593542 RepID=UPI0022E9F226|nr:MULTISPECIES: hypothetical protein [unclassified Campylobacter]MDA3054190.1 hypothetical protein [Campylobacter sp. VBCF_07 NA4]MDA3060881.1 hypothetical protein [Campylobacter sp. VBCF_02 NA5]MDA3070394.1 hypothetical protein [Campylobacter sp. VBCF_08 NA3]WBR53703.1 hypothetical protein PF027_05065 [Campylobacter sp. VBCF_01 NA2]